MPLTAAALLGFAALASFLYYRTGGNSPAPESAALPSPGITTDKGAANTGLPNFEILFSDGDRGLMAYEGYVYVVRLGDKLPNGRRTIGFQKRDGNWSAVTL